MKQKHRSARSFTLVELAVIIAISAMILTVTILATGCGQYSPFEKDRKDACAAKLKTLGTAILMYGNDFKDYVPVWDDENKQSMATNDNKIFKIGSDTTTPGNKLLLGGYMGRNLSSVDADSAEKTFECPSDKKNFNAKRGTASYIYMPLENNEENAPRRLIIGRDNPGAALMYDIHSVLQSGNTGGAAKLPNKGGNHKDAIQVIYMGGHTNAVQITSKAKLTFSDLDEIAY